MHEEVATQDLWVLDRNSILLNGEVETEMTSVDKEDLNLPSTMMGRQDNNNNTFNNNYNHNNHRIET